MIGEAKPVGASEAARKRAAVELIAKHEGSLQRTARRYSICDDDADDAYQRALEILLVKAPTDDVRELIRWMTTVVKHEALKVRESRRRTVAPRGRDDDETESDWVALIPAEGDGPAALAERREKVARSREALQALKPQELRALTLLAEGYSYEEIGAMTGYSRTRINRCLAEGRERFRAMVDRSEDGSRCEEMSPLLSAFCDGEASARDVAVLREHLRACAHCRAALRAYRAAPRAAAALAPLLPVAASRSLLERAQEALHGLYSRLPGQGGADSALSGMAAGGGTHGTGAAALAKMVAACVGTAGGAAACVATGVVPAPLGIGAEPERKPAIVRPAPDAPASPIDVPAPDPAPVEQPREEKEPAAEPTATAAEPVASSTETGAVEYTPPPTPTPAPAPAPSSSPSSSSSGNPAGEFGP